MAMYVVLKGTHWHSMDSQVFRLTPEPPDCCETVCDEVEINDPFVTLKRADSNAIFVQSSEIVLMREYSVEIPSGSNLDSSAGVS